MGVNQRAMIKMSFAEVAEFVRRQRTGTLATVGPNGQLHLVAMWYALLDDEIWLEAKTKSQKVLNLRRDPRMSFLIESGVTYQTLRGVSLEGVAEIIDDPELMWPVGVSMFNRYHGIYDEGSRSRVEAGLHNRVVIRFHVERTRSWDHAKLGVPDAPPSGSTAQYLGADQL